MVMLNVTVLFGATQEPLTLICGGGTGVFVGVAVGGTGVFVGGTGVLVGGTGVFVGGTGVAVGRIQPVANSDWSPRPGKL